MTDPDIEAAAEFAQITQDRLTALAEENARLRGILDRCRTVLGIIDAALQEYQR